MNKTKCIPFLALVAMLSACTVSNGGAKLRKYSKEVSNEDWNAHMNEIAGEEDPLEGDIESLVKISVKMVEKVTVDDKKTEYQEANGSGTSKAKYDKDSNVGYSETKITAKLKSGTDSATMSYTGNGNAKRYYQKATVDVEGTPTEKTVSVNKEHKEYYVLNDDVSTAAMSFALYPVMAAMFVPMGYATADAEEKANYKFFEDSKVFTCEYIKRTEEPQTHSVNEEQVVYRNDVTVESQIVQFEYKKKSGKISGMNVRFEQKEETTRTYVTDYQDVVEGTVIYELEDMIFDATLTAKDLQLQPVSLEGFVDGGEDIEIGFGD